MSVTITGKRIDGKEFSKKYRVSRLEKLDLSMNQLSSIDLRPLEGCTGLEELDLNGNQLSSIDLRPLEGCTGLYYLFLNNNQLSSIDLRPLEGCTGLYYLALNNNQLSSIDLSLLEGCTGLRRLKLSDNQLSSIDLRPLEGCTEIFWELDLSNNQLSSIDLRPLEKCKGLEELDLNNNQLSSIDLRPLEKCTRLEELDLNNNQLSSIDLRPLEKCKGLEELDLNGNQLSSIDLRPLEKCKGLYYLFLNNNQLSSIDLAPLIQCSVLKALTLDDNISIKFQSEKRPEKRKLPEALKIYYKELIIEQEEYILKKKRVKENEKDSRVFFKLFKKYQRVPTALELFQEGIPSERVNEVIIYINRLENFNISEFNLDEIIELDDKIKILTKIVKNPYELALPLIANELDIGASQTKKIMALLEHTLNSTKLHENHIKQAKLQLSDWADQNICHYLYAKNKVKEKDFITNLWKMSVNSEIGPWSIRLLEYFWQEYVAENLSLNYESSKEEIDKAAREIAPLFQEGCDSVETILSNSNVRVSQVPKALELLRKLDEKFAEELTIASTSITIEEDITSPAIEENPYYYRSSVVAACFYCGETLGEVEHGKKEVCNNCGKETFQCLICHQNVSFGQEIVQVKNCGHLFHRSHIIAWIQSHSNCPLCKNKINENMLEIYLP